jgi:hypothetical protein
MSRPRSSPLVAGAIFVLAVAGLLAAPATAGAAGSVATTGDTAPAPRAPGIPIAATNTTDIDPDAVVMAIAVAPNGSAAWRVAYRIRLDDENATAAFESLQADVARNESAYTARFARRMNRTATVAENATGRPMSVGTVAVSTRRESLPQEYGIVTYEFRWSGFAETSADRLLVGDAISGLYLDRQTTLRIQWPTGYRVSSVVPAPDERRSGAVIWRGPTEFAGDRPRLTFAPAAPDATTQATTAPPESPDATGGRLWPIGAILALFLVATLAWAVYRRGHAPAGGDGTDDDDGTVEAPGGPSAELLSNEERVLQLLEANGGRMKQQAIADELEWTDAKTSQVVGDLREADDVETFRLGRENVVTLPDAGGPIE